MKWFAYSKCLEAKVTRYVNDDFKASEKGRHNPPSSIGDYEFSGKTTEKDGITIHFYKRTPKREFLKWKRQKMNQNVKFQRLMDYLTQVIQTLLSELWY